MIIAGVLGPINENTFRQLDSFVGKKICGDRVYFKNNLVNIVAGTTSASVAQGSILSLESALLVGKVFSKKDYKAITKEDLEQQPGITNQLFVKKYWGNYIYVRIEDNIVKILRDPVGQFPLFYTKLNSGELLFSSEIEILVDMTKNRPGFNWKYFSSYVVHTFITTEQTAFEGIYELPHGCQISHNPINRLMECSNVWSPLDYLQGYKGAENAMDDIVRIASSVIESWTRSADVISIDFSGGTDSTSILFLLNKIFDKKKEIKLINRFHPDVSSSDERKYARATATALGLDLIEYDHSKKSLPFDPVYNISQFKPNWPTSFLSYLKINNDTSSLLEESKNVIYMSGHGGDHIFMCPPPVTSLCDYLIERGRNGFNKKAMDLYAIFREPLFSMARNLLNGFISYYMRSQYIPSIYAIRNSQRAPWFNKEIFLLEKEIRYHPFFYEESTTRSLPGKFWLIETIYSGLSTIKTDIRDDGTNPIFFPLFSQPLLELALSIPTYESYQDGYNRYLFRKAISDTFKTGSIWRQDKGETSGISQRGLRRNKRLLLDLCLDGNMVQQGLINREKLHAGMLGIMNGQIEYQWAVSELICAEIFMNSWK